MVGETYVSLSILIVSGIALHNLYKCSYIPHYNQKNLQFNATLIRYSRQTSNAATNPSD